MKKQNRRRFIKRSAAAVIVAPFLSTAVTRALAQAAEKKIGFALCGLGSLSTNQIAPALPKTKHCRLAGIITGTPAKAERWKAQYNIPDRNIFNYDTMSRLADSPDIDVVYVVTPNALHADHTIKAAKAGKHVLCEKPMEATPEKCQQMIDACKAAGRMLAIGYRCQFDPNHLECMRLAREKVFGNLKIVEAGFCIHLGDPTQWRLKKALAGGGALMDVGIYALQATRYLTGEEPILVSATETKTDPEKFKEVDESIVWEAKFPERRHRQLHHELQHRRRRRTSRRSRNAARSGWTRHFITTATVGGAATARKSTSRRWINSPLRWTILRSASSTSGRQKFPAKKDCAT